MYDNILKILRSLVRNNAPRSFRDPQEYIYGQPGNEASDVYSYGMTIFQEITGKEYFESVGIPEDEYFMFCDTENDFSIIDPANIPEEYSEISQLLCKMTMFRRESRISKKELNELISENNEEIETAEEKGTENIPEQENCSQTEDFPKCRDGFDYGIIVNNKRCGRIEFIELYSCQKNRGTYYDIPVLEPGDFKIPVSVRSPEYKGITNPSSVYGDCIIPAAMIKLKAEKGNSVRVELNRENDSMILSVSMTDINGNTACRIEKDQLEIIPYRNNIRN